MPLTILMFSVALCLSAVAAYYSIIGLTAIFAAAVFPIIIMGGILEIAKLTVTLWLHEYWGRCRLLMKSYLSVAVMILMLITSMGIFGFLSKAHNDQNLVSGDVQAKISIYDEKIRIAKENIDANRRQLKQMDEAVDQIMGRSTTETGAERSVQIRRQQGPERQRLIREIETEQKKITALNEERAPIAAEVRKVEAEVGPIKYIAALIYDETQDSTVLERAVRWVIIMLVVVFDPLAVMMLLAASESLKWLRNEREQSVAYEADDGPLTPEQINQIKESVQEGKKPSLYTFEIKPPLYPATEDDVEELRQEFERVRNAVYDKDVMPDSDEEELQLQDNSIVKQAMVLWKQDNPNATLKEQRKLHARGLIDRLPWEDYLYDPRLNLPKFGKELPTPKQSTKGDLFINTKTQPTKLYKFNGERWIVIDKSTTDQYAFSQGYIEYLIDALEKGEYDTELLTEAEKAEIQSYLQRNT